MFPGTRASFERAGSFFPVALVDTSITHGVSDGERGAKDVLGRRGSEMSAAPRAPLYPWRRQPRIVRAAPARAVPEKHPLESVLALRQTRPELLRLRPTRLLDRPGE